MYYSTNYFIIHVFTLLQKFHKYINMLYSSKPIYIFIYPRSVYLDVYRHAHTVVYPKAHLFVNPSNVSQ